MKVMSFIVKGLRGLTFGNAICRVAFLVRVPSKIQFAVGRFVLDWSRERWIELKQKLKSHFKPGSSKGGNER